MGGGGGALTGAPSLSVVISASFGELGGGGGGFLTGAPSLSVVSSASLGELGGGGGGLGFLTPSLSVVIENILVEVLGFDMKNRITPGFEVSGSKIGLLVRLLV